MKRAYIVLVLVVSMVLLPGAAFGIQAQPYENESNQTGESNWTENRTQVTLQNLSHYVSRVGTFVVGTSGDDAGIGPIVMGMLVGFAALLTIGQSRAGLVASGTMAVIVVAALSAPAGAGLLPRWLYGATVMLIALVAGLLYIKTMR